MIRQISPQGEAFLKQFEELRLTPYRDQAGKWTVGWGHLMHSSESRTETITLTRAKELFRSDAERMERCVNEEVSVPLVQNEFDALVILVFNIGVAAFENSTLLRLLHSPAAPVEDIEKWWKVWNKVKIDGRLQTSNGLVNRRAAEWRIWSAGYYGEGD